MSDIRLIKQSENLVHGWSGGKTAEIFLFPEGSDYRKKDFQLRVSAAFTNVEGSPYSDFTGYTRHISPVTGVMDIRHEGHHSVVLQPYDVDVFDGGWTTTSRGIYSDFNLLHTADWNGLMKSFSKGQTIECTPCGYTGVFATCPIEIRVGNDSFSLQDGDFLLVQLQKGESESVDIAGNGSEPAGFFVRMSRK